MSTRKSQLSREKIAAAALAIADREGFQQVSMRRLAQELNVGTMTLYYYVKTKDDLVAIMDDALMAEALLPSLPKDWRRALFEIAIRTHALFLRHPWALVSMLSAPPGINAMRHFEQCLEALRETSMTTKQKFTLLALVDDFVFGHALRESTVAAADLKFARKQIATGAFPRIAEVFGDGRIHTAKDRFKVGLALLLDGKDG
ncbi:MAG: TetR/AcrR family transcriptional regulator [Candidatus Sulfotelmatobacter sp.]